MRRGFVSLVGGVLLIALVGGARAADPDAVWREKVRSVVTTNGLVLASGKVLIGQSTGAAAAKTLSGDATVSTAGVVTAAGLTTNLVVLGAATNAVTLRFTNGLLRVVQ